MSGETGEKESGWTVDTLNSLMEKELKSIRDIVDERDRRYGSQFDASNQAVKDALVAQKELTAAAFTASKEAINKAEAASNTNDAKNNEFRSQLKDQAASFPTRIEMDNKIDGLASQISEAKKDLEKYKDQQAIEIRGLRESRAEGAAVKNQVIEDNSQKTNDSRLNLSIIAVVFTGFFSTAALIIGIINIIRHP